MPKKNQKTNPNEIRFAALYVANGRNATEAYQTVFPRVKRNTAASEGSQWLRKPNVLAEIQRLTDEAFKREHMSANEVLQEMARLARSDVSALTWRPGELDSAGNATSPGALKPLYEMPEAVRRTIKSIKRDVEGRIEIALWSKDTALTNIGKHHKLLTETIDVNFQPGFADKLRAAREKRLKGGK